MNQQIQEIMRKRFSCRSYLDEPIQESDQQQLKEFIKSLETGPMGTNARFELVSSTYEDRQSLKGLGTYGFIKNPTGFIIGAVEDGPKNLEDYGYLMEQAILAATDIGLGTCWLGGSFTKSSFARKISLCDGESIPAVAATGYMTERAALNGQIRKYLGAKKRLPAEQLFFANKFGNPLEIEESGSFAQILEMVRWAPSASNKQPWRIVRNENAWHFYLQRTKGYGKGTLLFNVLRLADLQRVDMGIAMCHFELAAQELGRQGHWLLEKPDILKPEDTEYTVSWIGNSIHQK
jgi:nitroreductase